MTDRLSLGGLAECEMSVEGEEEVGAWVGGGLTQVKCHPDPPSLVTKWPLLRVHSKWQLHFHSKVFNLKKGFTHPGK